MSEVKRFQICGGDWEGKPHEKGEWVLALDFDRVTAERDALQALLDKEVSGDSRAPQPQGEPVAWKVYWADNGEHYFTCHKKERCAKLIADPEFKVQALYAEHTVPVATKKNDR